jgi:hypothetical protein
MSDRALAAPVKTEDTSISNQNTASATAMKFLQELSTGLKNSDMNNGTQAQDDLQALTNKPSQKQVLAQIDTDTKNATLMKSLGLTGSVQKGPNGEIQSLTFTSAAGVQAYNSQLLGLEKAGETPTQAANSMASEASANADTAFYTGKITLNADGLTPAEEQETSPAPAANAQDTPAAAAPAPDLGYPGSGISVNGGVDYDNMSF